MQEATEALDGLTDEQLDQRRRDTLAEQERRQKLTDGQARIGSTVRDYFTAARLDLPELNDEELGQRVIERVPD